MATTFFSRTLNGVDDFTNIYGDNYSWGGGKYIQHVSFEQDNGDYLDAIFDLAGSDWVIEYFHFWSSADGIARVTDTDAGTGRYIRHMTLQENSVVSLDTTRVDYIDGSSNAASHDVTLGSAGAVSVNVRGTENHVETGSGYVSSIYTGGIDTVIVNGGADVVNTGDLADTIRLLGSFTGLVETGRGADTVIVNGGNAGRVHTGDGADTVRLLGNNVELLSTGNGNDKVISNGGRANTVNLSDGFDTVVVRNGGRLDSVNGGDGNTNVTVEAGARIDRLFVSNGTHTLEAQDDGRINQIYGDESVLNLKTGSQFTNQISLWRSDATLDIGSGGVGSIELFSDQAQTHTIMAAGWVRGVEIGDGQTLTATFDGGGGRVSLGDQDDTVVVRNDNGFDVINTREGNDLIRLINGGSSDHVRAHDGDDTVIVNGGYVRALVLGNGMDSATFRGDGGADFVRGGGDNTVTLQEDARVTYVRLFDGSQTIDVQDQTARLYSIRVNESDATMTLNGGFTESIWSYNASNDITVGETGSVAQMAFGSDGTHSQKIVVGGWTGSIQVFDNQAANITVTGEVGTIRTEDGRDRVAINGGSADYVSTGGGIDKVFGGGGSDNVRAGLGNDLVRGRGGADEIYGEGGRDRLFGDVGNDSIYGGAGLDRINGGAGNDTLLGEAGNDQFIFGKNSGEDWVLDFQDGSDVIRLLNQVGGFGSLTIEDVGDDLRITHDNGVIYLEDLAGTVLTAADFIF